MRSGTPATDPLFSPEQQANFKMRHAALVEKQVERPGEIIFEHCNVETGYSLLLLRCDCTTNPHCTGFVMGTIDFEHGCRAAAAPTRDELQRLAEAILKAVAQ